jgi:formyltetrahydrofolate deformylase
MHVLRLNCEDKPGIVAAVATALRDSGCNIEESAQFFDPHSGQFFMRVVFRGVKPDGTAAFEKTFPSVAAQFSMRSQVCDLAKPVKTLLMVSKGGHCLNDILYRWRTGSLPIDIAGIASNHTTLKPLADAQGLPFHHLPVTPETKTAQEEQISQIVQQTNTELIVLARYMQVLSDDFCTKFAGRVINIHHSFLPGFKGAKPYHQAYDRGVKIIGATAHFATPDLDEGPIIAQGVEPVDHTHTPEQMQILGQDTESRVLTRAIKLYAERRIFLHGRRTVIL